jgi:hypothetical protein
MNILLKQIFTLAFSSLMIFFSYAQGQQITVGMDKITLVVKLSDAGRLMYAVDFDKRPVIRWSGLGFSLETDSNFYQGFEIIGSSKRRVDKSWQPVWGEVKTIRDHYEELKVRLRQQKSPHRLLDIVFRVFADGVGFRYEFPKQSSLQYFIVKDEYTQFVLAGDHQAFWIPGDFDSNEYLYSRTRISNINNSKVVEDAKDIAVRTVPDPFSVQTPLMMKSADGLYINIHEAALINYPAMQLHVNRDQYELVSSLVPSPTGSKAYLHAPFHTPWRTILVSDKATDILSSKMILNLNEPSKIKNTTWIKPMKYVGVWWEMQTGKSTWSYSDFADSVGSNGRAIPNKKHGASLANVKRYIDFAARNGIGGVLVEGWNTGWEDWFGNWKENVFDFVTPYPDFPLKEITDYARKKRVKLIMHNETSGSATNYERQLDTAFRLMNRFGYSSVKTGYVGRIIPRGEYHDGQWMINHYERVAQKALQHKIMIDVHEPVRPTGLHRTYPNWLASEAGRGNEYNAFSNGSPPEHETILPFTRLIGGPMDYTPGIFKLKNYVGYAPERQMHTTLAKQLALYVTIYSPLQMAADYPEHYEAKADAFQFIRDVAVDWDDTRVLEAEPGDYVTIARKAKGRENWFIGAVSDENPRTANISLSFLPAGKKYIAIIYRDADDAHWESNPEAYVIERMPVGKETILNIKLAAGGGCAVHLKPM